MYHYGLNDCDFQPHTYVETLIPSVMVFVDGTFMNQLILPEIMRIAITR